jgi:hypothetical protein
LIATPAASSSRPATTSGSGSKPVEASWEDEALALGEATAEDSLVPADEVLPELEPELDPEPEDPEPDSDPDPPEELDASTLTVAVMNGWGAQW